MSLTTTPSAATPAALRDFRQRLSIELAKVVQGQTGALELMTLGLLCRGHVLLLGVPGLGKTVMANTLARALDLRFSRVQFTPDLMPSDITGSDVIEEDPATGRRHTVFHPGPVFANFLLADEINRTPPKTQAALLQAMQEHEVTVGGNTHTIEPPFLVVATQNPIENEGTYVLPEAQLDRFMFCARIDYPTPAEELEIVRSTTGPALSSVGKAASTADILAFQKLVREVPASDEVSAYAVALATATRPNFADANPTVVKYVTCGASPRASQNLLLGAKARALLDGRSHVDFEDISALAHAVIEHRLVLNFRSRADRVDARAVVDSVLAAVKPRS